MSSPSSFHLFGQLPTELQEHIWRYAATPFDILELNHNIFLDSAMNNQLYHDRCYVYFTHCAPSRRSPLNMYRWNYTNDRNANTIATARNAMRQACRLSREVVLMAWRNDVEGIIIRQDLFISPIYGKREDVIRRKHELEAELVEYLTKLIA